MLEYKKESHPNMFKFYVKMVHTSRDRALKLSRYSWTQNTLAAGVFLTQRQPCYTKVLQYSKWNHYVPN